MIMLEACNIDFSYGRNPIFHNASLEIPCHSIVGILGPNGSGKTTFFDIICGLKTTTSGGIKNNSIRQLYLSQTVMTPPALQMSDIFKMIATLSSDEKATQHQALEKLTMWCPEIIERYKEIWRKKSSFCSYGEKRWFFTLALLSLGADFIVLDEPTAGVDPEFRHYIWQCLKGASSEGAAILISSHNIDEIAQNCDKFYMIAKKQFCRFGSAQEYMSHYKARTLDEAFILSASE